MAFRILSIDGGGLRGIIPLIILERLLKITGRNSISDSFDLIAGTSTGGIIACALSLKAGGKNKFTIDEIKNLYVRHSKDIFPPPTKLFLGVNHFFSPKYRHNGLESVLNQYFGDHTLQDCKTPILVSAYDVNNYNAFYYSSRLVNPTSAGSLSNTQFRLADICRSTSAAPTYFASHYFSFLNGQTQTQSTHNLIDGGVFVNNPSLAAYTEVLEHPKDSLYQRNPAEPIKPEDIYVLSLGTGIGARTITRKQGAQWGQVKWASRLFDIMMQGNSLSVHNQMSVLLRPENYLRLNLFIPNDAIEMDDSSDSTREKLIREVNKNIINNQVDDRKLTQFVNAAGL